jgi:hypothetical protein
MTDIVEQARKVVELHGDTYSSYEVVGLLGQLVAEVERLRADGIRLRAQRYELADEIERLRALLKEARQYVSDAGNDEDPETQYHSSSLLLEIDR